MAFDLRHLAVSPTALGYPMSVPLLQPQPQQQQMGGLPVIDPKTGLPSLDKAPSGVSARASSAACGGGGGDGPLGQYMILTINGAGKKFTLATNNKSNAETHSFRNNDPTGGKKEWVAYTKTARFHGPGIDKTADNLTVFDQAVLEFLNDPTTQVGAHLKRDWSKGISAPSEAPRHAPILGAHTRAPTRAHARAHARAPTSQAPGGRLLSLAKWYCGTSFYQKLGYAITGIGILFLIAGFVSSRVYCKDVSNNSMEAFDRRTFSYGASKRRRAEGYSEGDVVNVKNKHTIPRISNTLIGGSMVDKIRNVRLGEGGFIRGSDVPLKAGALVRHIPGGDKGYHHNVAVTRSGGALRGKDRLSGSNYNPDEGASHMSPAGITRINQYGFSSIVARVGDAPNGTPVAIIYRYDNGEGNEARPMQISPTSFEWLCVPLNELVHDDQLDSARNTQ